MKLYWILFSAIVLIGIYVPCEGHIQDFIDNYVDIEKFKQEGFKSLNETALKHIWTFFKTKYLRHYSSSDEEKQRIGIFRDHLKRVLESNIQINRTFQLALNQYSDWTLEEFNAFKKGLAIPTNIIRNTTNDQNNEESFRRSLSKLYQDHYHSRKVKRNLHERFDNRGLSDDWFQNQFDEGDDEAKRDDNDNNNGIQSTAGFDWRSKNVVSSIKDQGQCGSCYSFATLAAMESVYAIKKKSTNVINFSPQQIVDCSSGNSGCNGGNFEPSVNYISKQGGKIATTASYPYVGKKGKCKTDNLNKIDLGKIVYTLITQGDEIAMATALVNYGPMYIAINADSDLFMYYSAGVLQVKNCANGPYDLDHAVVVVGYGYDNVLKKSYWIIKNSWGTDWGENGYIRIAKDAGNMCGVATEAYSTKLT